MNLGLWNRLAVVAAAVATLAIPTWIVASENSKIGKLGQIGFDRCMRMDWRQPPKGETTFGYCFDTWLGANRYLGFDDWTEIALWMPLVCAIVYALIWLTVWVAKWVWRGKKNASAK